MDRTSIMKFTINETPVSASRPRVTRWGTFYSKKYNDYKNMLKIELKKIFSLSKLTIIEKETPIKIEINFYFPFTKSYSKKKKLMIKENNYFHIIKPDLDNLEKSILDGMNDIIYVDDCQICNLSSSKRYTEDLIGRTEVIITELN